MLFPVANVLLIIASIAMDTFWYYNGCPVAHLTIAVVVGTLFYYIWLHMQFAAEHENALRGRAEKKEAAHVTVETFGEFNIFVDGKVVDFSRSKAKEVLAYLVDRQGKFQTRSMIFYALWEGDARYDRPMQKYLDVILSSLRDTLKAYGIEDIIERSKGQIRVVPEKLSCDLYRFFDGDIQAVDAYHGEYMSTYSWANMTEAYMSHISGVGGIL